MVSRAVLPVLVLAIVLVLAAATRRAWGERGSRGRSLRGDGPGIDLTLSHIARIASNKPSAEPEPVETHLTGVSCAVRRWKPAGGWALSCRPRQ